MSGDISRFCHSTTRCWGVVTYTNHGRRWQNWVPCDCCCSVAACGVAACGVANAKKHARALPACLCCGHHCAAQTGARKVLSCTTVVYIASNAAISQHMQTSLVCVAHCLCRPHVLLSRLDAMCVQGALPARCWLCGHLQVSQATRGRGSAAAAASGNVTPQPGHMSCTKCLQTNI